MIEDSLTTKKTEGMANKLFNMNTGGAKKTVRIDDKAEITLMKIPLLRFIYFIFLESEKISDEFNKYITGKPFFLLIF